MKLNFIAKIDAIYYSKSRRSYINLVHFNIKKRKKKKKNRKEKRNNKENIIP